MTDSSGRMMASESATTGPSGTTFSNGVPLLLSAGAPADTDADGLPDTIEAVIGTDPTKYSTAGDGISDGAKVQQGLDPLGNRPMSTGVVAGLPLLGEAQQVTLVGSTVNATQQTAYVATGSYGLAIVDVSQFQKPVVLSQLKLPGDATSVSLDSKLQIAAVADGSGGLVLVDVSNPLLPKVTHTNTDATTQVVAVDGLAYAAISGGGLASYDMLTGDRLQVLFLTAGTITGLAREGDLIYVMDDDNTLHVVDISKPLVVARGSISLPDGGGQLVVGGGIAYVAATSNVYGGYDTVNVADPDHPTLIAKTSATQTAAAPDPVLAVNGSGIMLAANAAVRGATSGVQVFDSSDPSNTGNFLTDFPLADSPNGVAIASGIAFVADGSAGLQVVNYLPFDTKGKSPTISVDAGALDTDPNTPGIQVLEGSDIHLNATVSDDVQVRNVELLINGQVAVNDVSFPFDLSTFLPSIAAAGNIVTIEVKATDTGGNMATTGPIALNLTHDTTPPAIISTSPAAGATRGQNFRTVIVDFSKPMDPATITASTIVVTGPGVSLAPDNIQFRFNNTEVQLTFPAAALPLGSYQLVIHAASITDVVGNPLGNADVVVPFAIAHIDTWINPAGGDWSVPTNWDGGQVPQAGDDVLIDVPGNPTITYGFASGTTTLHSLVSKDPFTMTGGTLTATQSIEVDNTFTIIRGTIKNTSIQPGSGGQGVTIAGASTCTFDGVTSNADIRFANPNGSAQLAIANGLTLNGTAYLGEGAYSDYLLFNGTQSLAGTGTIVFGANNGVLGMNFPGTLTIGSGMTIHGQRGILNFYSPGSFINQGTIIADVPDQSGISVNTGFVNQGTMRVVNNGTLTLRGLWSNTASGSITSNASTLNLGSGNDSWTNAGAIQAANGSAVNLGGLFTLAGLGSFTTTASTVSLTGTLDNTNTTLALNAATGSWNLRGGTLKGGSYTSADGSQLLFGSGTLDGVTLNSDITIPSSVTVLDGLTLNAVIHLGTASLPGTLSFSGAQELAGNGAIVLGSDDYNQVNSSGGTLTIDGGITIRGQAGTVTGNVINEGTIAADTPGDSFGIEIVGTAPGIINQGTIRATNGSILYVAGAWTNSTTGAITADASTLWLGNGTNAWNNAGSISSTNGSTVNLESTFTLANLGNFQRSGGTVNLYGTLNNTGTTLALNATTGSWQMGSGGTIIGGDYTSADGASLIISSNNGTLNGVTLDGDLYVAGQNPAVVIKNGLTLNGTIYLGDTSGNLGSLLYYGSQTITGAGSVVFVGTSGNGIGPQLLSTSLNIGSGITIRGKSGSIYGFGSGSAITDQGTVSADVAGGTIGISGASFTNQGTLSATGGGVLNVSGLALPMAGTITAGAGGTVAVSGNLTLSSTSTVNVELGGTTTDKFGRITATGAASFDGTLNISLVNSFQPVSGNSFKVMTFASETGQFATINGTSIPNSLVLAPTYDTGDLTLVAGQALMAAVGIDAKTGSDAGSADALTAAEAAPLLTAAIDRWAAAGVGPLALARLNSIDVSIARLGGNVLGLAAGNQIFISDDAHGFGWFVDPTPLGDVGFAPTLDDHVFSAISGSGAAGKMDLLTVLVHELGHELGLGDILGGGAMNETLAPGQRGTPTAQEVDALLAEYGT
ncbi:MAG TPA: Ig-like domain-containing protein [Pirellulales bacterium]|nr:Ig-like domain-containing protein [Pirellulales bacterium]